MGRTLPSGRVQGALVEAISNTGVIQPLIVVDQIVHRHPLKPAFGRKFPNLRQQRIKRWLVLVVPPRTGSYILTRLIH